MSVTRKRTAHLNPAVAWWLLGRAGLVTAAVLAMGCLAVWLVPLRWRPEVPEARWTDGYHDGQRGDLQALAVSPAFIPIGTKQGVAVLDRETSLWRDYNCRNTSALPENDVVQVVVDRERGRFLFRTRQGGLAGASSRLGDWQTLYPLSSCPAPVETWRVATLLKPPGASHDTWLALGTYTHGLA